jgi:flagellar hook-length control protein FliK
MVVRILTEQPMVKEIIETHLHQLKAELHHQGLTIDRFEVMVKPDVDQQANRDSFAHNTNHQSSQHGRRQGREPNPQNPSRENSGQAMQERSQGSGINYFA